MKTTLLKMMLAVLAVTVLVSSGVTALAQPATVNAPVPQLAYGVPQILRLAQAKVSDDTIIAYIKNSGNSYGLNADQIIYLRQQGISDAVLTTMLSQPRAGMAVASPTTPAPQPMASPAYNGPVSSATAGPAVSYVQTVPDTVYYSQPYYYDQPYYGYPDYAWYPPVIFPFGWGGGWGGGWHGGRSFGGWHGGGTFGHSSGGFSGGRHR